MITQNRNVRYEHSVYEKALTKTRLKKGSKFCKRATKITTWYLV